MLTPVFRQPFDMIALEAVACAEEKAAGVASDDLLQNRLPWIDTYRTFLAAPPAEVRTLFLAVSEFRAAV